MKKLFTQLILCILVSGLGVRTNAQETVEEDNSYLTIEVIENSFWDKLESFNYPVKTKEDEYLTWLIDGIREPTNTIPAFGDLPYISLGIGGFREEEIDFERFIYKCQRIIDLYNHTHDLQLMMKASITCSEMLQIDVQSKKPDFIENMVILTGQLAHVKETMYWESAQNYGSGKNGVTETRVVQVNGAAYLDENGEVQSSYYGKTPKQIEMWAPRMLHICTEDTDLGWVYPTQLTCIDE